METSHSDEANRLLERIRAQDARIGLIVERSSTAAYIEVDLFDPRIIELGLGLDVNGAYPAL